MGIVFNYKEFTGQQLMGIPNVIVYCNPSQEMLNRAVSLNVPLAKNLVKFNPKRRTMRLESEFNSILNELPDNSFIKDFDVLFNPEYNVNLLKIFIEARKRKSFRVIWPGKYENGRLYYAEDGYKDFKVYNIDDFDITVVI